MLRRDPFFSINAATNAHSKPKRRCIREEQSPEQHPELAIEGKTNRWEKREDRQQLLADIQTPDDVQVAFGINLFQIIQQSTTTTHHHQQATAACMILLVRPHMLSQAIDPSRQDRNLHLWGTRIGIAPAVARDHFLLSFFRNRHSLYPIILPSIQIYQAVMVAAC